MLVIRQTGALLMDAQRALRAAKIFWGTLALVVISTAAFAGLSFTDSEIVYFGLKFEAADEIATLLNSIPPQILYVTFFTAVIVPYFLNWGLTVLALLSTAGLMPDLVREGGVDPILSRPIGRSRLYLTRFATGLLFVAVQIGIFTLGWFLIIGFRTEHWLWKMWLTVPLVVLTYAYLFGVCALVGLVTRSTVTAIALTALLWIASVAVDTAAGIFLMGRETSAARIDRNQQRIALIAEELQTEDLSVGRRVTLTTTRKGYEQAIEAERASLERWSTAFAIVDAAELILPDTGRTLEYITIWAVGDPTEIFADEDDDPAAATPAVTIDTGDTGDEETPEQAAARVNAEFQGDMASAAARVEAFGRTHYTTARVFGSSVTFLAVMLILGCVWISRKDY